MKLTFEDKIEIVIYFRIIMMIISLNQYKEILICIL